MTYGQSFKEDFESMSDGAVTGTWTLKMLNCNGTSAASIDSTKAHGGKKSLKITGTAGYCNHVFASPVKDLSSIGAIWYVRVWMQHTTAFPQNHVTFIAMKDASYSDKNDIRIGAQNKILMWNRENDDQTIPEMVFFYNQR